MPSRRSYLINLFKQQVRVTSNSLSLDCKPKRLRVFAVPLIFYCIDPSKVTIFLSSFNFFHDLIHTNNWNTCPAKQSHYFVVVYPIPHKKYSFNASHTRIDSRSSNHFTNVPSIAPPAKEAIPKKRSHTQTFISCQEHNACSVNGGLVRQKL